MGEGEIKLFSKVKNQFRNGNEKIAFLFGLISLFFEDFCITFIAEMYSWVFLSTCVIS